MRRCLPCISCVCGGGLVLLLIFQLVNRMGDLAHLAKSNVALPALDGGQGRAIPWKLPWGQTVGAHSQICPEASRLSSGVSTDCWARQSTCNFFSASFKMLTVLFYILSSKSKTFRAETRGHLVQPPPIRVERERE